MRRTRQSLNKEEQQLLTSLLWFVRRQRPQGNEAAVFSGLLGELLACKEMRARWKPGTGYDGIFKGKRISIKTRRRPEDKNKDKSPRMGVFRPDALGQHNFEFGWYVELNSDYSLRGIWQLPKDEVLVLQAKAGKDKKNRPRGIPVRRFMKTAGKPIWHRGLPFNW